ncbi:uroporphyrinogen decarboxylase family protein [Blautia marasmi]|uniref:uroporphyrinogen decarboxylase family protein n=1 Tax=Blautia marasmi TaxID=1917868 RepID=UPI000CF2BB7B|nr:uroporphyrinogen decarboxylase family protein [Blautia marasmi]
MKEYMSSYERCLAAIGLQEVDRIPTDLHDFLMCAEDSGMDFGQFVLDDGKMAEMQIKMWEEFGHDMLLIENGTAALAQALGCGVVYRKKGAPVAHTTAIKKLEDIRDMEIPQNIWDSPLLNAQILTVQRLVQHFGKEVFLIGRGDQGPFSLASQLYGMDRLLEDLMDEEAKEDVHRLLDLCTEACVQYHEKLLSLGVPMTSMGDSTAGPDVISPAMYETFAAPYEKRVIDAVHAKGGMISLHICGNATKIIDKMCNLGADILEIDQKTNLEAAVRESRGKCALLGQINPVLLSNGTQQEVTEAVERTLETVGGKTSTGFILGPGCALGGDTPKENVHILVNSVQII